MGIIESIPIVLFVVLTLLNYIMFDIKVTKLKNEVIEKDLLISAFVALDKAISKLNSGFKDHEQRIIDIENHLSSGEKHFELSKEPKEPEKPKYTCNDCKYYHALSGVGFNGISLFKCEKIGRNYTIECNNAYQAFEKEEDLDEDENVFYANNVKIDISSKKEPRVYKTDRILSTREDYVDYISRLFMDGGISAADMSMLLEKLKQ